MRDPRPQWVEQIWVEKQQVRVRRVVKQKSVEKVQHIHGLGERAKSQRWASEGWL